MKVCKKCLQEKSLEEFYSHPWTLDKRLWSCKECVKEERRSEHWRAMARINDKKRFNDPKRKAHQKKHLQEFRKNNPEKWNAQKMVNNFLRNNKEMKKKNCSICWKECRVHYHHFDYTKPNEVIPCCAMDHSKFHHWKLEVQSEWIFVLPVYP